MRNTAEPQTVTELLQRAQQIAGLTLAQLAEQCDFQLPKDFQKHKGWLGQLLELALGASAGSKAQPDFMALNIELKTIPINEAGKPVESTFVCAVPQKIAVEWHNSLVWHKLRSVLWVPIEAKKAIPERRIGQAILWQPSREQEQQLCEDWQELTEMLTLGQADKLTARHGQVLQIRPKAANSHVLKKAVDEQGHNTLIVPRGFYLRPSFTMEILKGCDTAAYHHCITPAAL